jgi:hypothetical protein
MESSEAITGKSKGLYAGHSLKAAWIKKGKATSDSIDAMKDFLVF